MFRHWHCSADPHPTPAAATAPPRGNLPHRLRSHLLRRTALEQNPGHQADALYLSGQWSHMSGMGYVQWTSRCILIEHMLILWGDVIFCLLLSVQRPVARCMVGTLMASLVFFLSCSWERRTTPVLLMDAQMVSSGVLPPLTTKKTSSTLSALRRTVSARKTEVELIIVVYCHFFQHSS